MLNKIKNLLGTKSPSEEPVEETVDEPVEETVDEPVEETVDEPVEEKEKWIWVNGFKGTDKDMKCHGGFQYELGKRYDMPEGEEVRVCSSGFHLCLELWDVQKHVPIGYDNRFFRVKALVRKCDVVEYGHVEYGVYGAHYKIDILAAKSIEFIQELTVDEILQPHSLYHLEGDYRKLALSIGLDNALGKMHVDELVRLGYSLPFATWLQSNKKYGIAKAVGSQQDLSMDMKCLMIATSQS